MKLSTKYIKYESMKSLDIELKLNIAIAKVDGNDLLVNALSNEEAAGLFVKNSVKILKKLKKQGIIQFFVYCDDMSDVLKTETAYILNKFPSIRELLPQNKVFFVIRL